MVFEPLGDWQNLYTVNNVPGGYQVIGVNDNARVSLVDFGLSEEYIIEGEDKHVRFEQINRTLGNKFFMSLNQLKKYGKRHSMLIFASLEQEGRPGATIVYTGIPGKG